MSIKMIGGHATLATVFGVLLYLSFTTSHVLSGQSLRTGSCTLSFFNSMRAYECVGLNLSKIPQHLSSSTEILDVSMNRIRELSKSSFQNYVHLIKLYLNDNMIMTIETGTFDDLDKLETLDLSMNALVEMPPSVLHLTSLAKLMLASNIRLDVADLLNKAIPITAPLQLLDLSFCPLLTQLPRFGVMMDLLHLNVTGNHLGNVSINNFVGLCNLKWFSTENATIEFASSCDCARIDRWLQRLKVRPIPPFTPRCAFTQERCDDVEPIADDYVAHEQCTVKFQARENIRSITRVCYIVFGLIGGIMLFVGVCYVYYRTQRLPEKDGFVTKQSNENESNNSDTLLKPNNNVNIL